MKVIHQKPVDKLGVPGDVADVADGYARNYLIPQGMAVKASKNMVNHADSLRRAHEKRRYAMKGEYEAQASKVISGGPIRVAAKAGEEGKLFGSITSQDIAAALTTQGFTVDKRKLELEHPIKTVGFHSVIVRLQSDVHAEVKVNIVPE